MSTAPAGKQRWAVCADADGADADAIRRRLLDRGATEPQWFRARDAEDVDQAVRSGAVDAVLFPDIDAVLTAMLDGFVDLDQWAARGVTLELLRAPAAATDWTVRADSTLAAPAPAASLRVFQCVWTKWNAVQRRRRTVAGFVLSLVALLAATSVVILSRP